jgi:hypothetical protein
MEWQLPIQKVEIANINISSPWASASSSQHHKPLAPLSYFGMQFRLPFITLLFPPLTVLDYNPQSGRLVLDMSVSNLACIKLNTLQETLVNAIFFHQQAWFRTEFTKEEIKGGFQPMIEESRVILYCPAAARNLPIYKNGKWQQLQSQDLTPGVKIRVATKIHGISFLTKPPAAFGEHGVWSGRCRLQHRIQGIIVQN